MRLLRTGAKVGRKKRLWACSTPVAMVLTP